MFNTQGTPEFSPHIFDDMQMEISDIENDISTDIDDLIAGRFDSLYCMDVYKKHHISIEIIYPRMQYARHKMLVKSPDYFRFLLSLYPFDSDLENIQKIVIRPRHVVLGGVELVGLYLHKKKVLTTYLHQPHFYSLKASRFAEYSELTSLMHVWQEKKSKAHINEHDPLLIHPLWYMLSIIEPSSYEKVDKFLLRCAAAPKVAAALDEVSFYYTQHGY